MKTSIVASVYNEEDVLSSFHKKLCETLNNELINYELIYVNDGSTDKTEELILEFQKSNPSIKYIAFSRNFGHEAAMIAGIDYASGDVVICMDSDLQHPPSEIIKMINEYHNGFDIVTMARENKKQNISSVLFYKLINWISPFKIQENASDFFLVSAKVADVLRNNYRERTRFLRGLIQIIGFKKSTLIFTVSEREQGKTKYSKRKLISLTMTAVSSLSKLPLKAGILIGIICGFLSFILAIFSLVMKFIDQPVSGYTTIVVFLGFMFSIQFILLGILGEYLGFIFDEQKKRPIYIVDKTTNIEIIK